MSENLIVIKKLSKSYLSGKSKLTVLKGLSLGIKKAEFLVITGVSGAGKSTLLHLIGGLDKPDAGEIIFENENICAMKENKLSGMRNNKIGFVFQFYHLLPELSALENIGLPLFIGRKQKGWKAKAFEMLRVVRMEEKANCRVNELSGGEQQRLGIARALINDPDVVLADEPTGNLDGQNAEIILDLLRKLNENRKMTIIIATHNTSLAGSGGRTLALVDGKLICY